MIEGDVDYRVVRVNPADIVLEYIPFTLTPEVVHNQESPSIEITSQPLNFCIGHIHTTDFYSVDYWETPECRVVEPDCIFPIVSVKSD